MTEVQKYDSIQPMSEEEILKILNNMKKTTCDVDPCNMNFLMEFRDVLLGTWTKIINKSLLSGHFLQFWKKAIIRPLINPPNCKGNSKLLTHQ